MNKTTTKTFKLRVNTKHNMEIQVTSEFKGWKVGVRFKCRSCKHEWETRPQNVISGTGCPICAKRKTCQ